MSPSRFRHLRSARSGEDLLEICGCQLCPSNRPESPRGFVECQGEPDHDGPHWAELDGYAITWRSVVRPRARTREKRRDG